MADYEDFVLLGLDLAELDKKRCDLAELVKRQDEARAKMLALRPSDKDYSKNTSDLVSLTNALEAQIQAARGDVAAEEKRLKLDAIMNVGRYVDGLWKQIQDLDTQVIKALLSAREMLIERDQVSQELDKRAGILNGYNYELQAGRGVHTPKLPWLADWPGWQKALELFVSRFLKLQAGNAPEAGKELDWFSRKVI